MTAPSRHTSRYKSFELIYPLNAIQVGNLNEMLRYLYADARNGTTVIQASQIDPTLIVPQGGTGIVIFNIGDLIYASGTTTLSPLGIGAPNSVLWTAGVVPAWTVSPIVTSLTSSRSDLTTTSTDGLILLNPTAALVGVQTQYSPRLRLTGTAWKSNATAASQTDDFIIENRPVPGAAVTTALFALAAQINAGGYTDRLTLDSDGQAVISTKTGTGGLVSLTCNNDDGVAASSHALFRVRRGAGVGNATGVALGYLSDGATDTAGFVRSTGNDMPLLLGYFGSGSGDLNEVIRIVSTNRVGIMKTAPTAVLHLGAGTATASTGPLKFTSGPILTAPEAGASEYNGNFYLTNSAPIRFPLGGPLFDHIVDAGNGTTVETDLYTDTLAANTVNITSDKVTAQYAGIFVASATATRQLKVYFGGTAIFDSGALSISAGSDAWNVLVTIMRESATVVRCAVNMTTTGAALTAYSAYTRVTGLTLSGTNILKITGTAAGVGAATDDIVAKLGFVSFVPAA